MQNPALAIRDQLGPIPTQPGCYLWRDKHKRVIYVGKAKNLKNRLNSYFAPPNGLTKKTLAMLTAARSVEWIIVASELESLHLEYTLIKRHRPRYNVVFNDEKTLPMLAITNEPIPRIMMRRKIVKDGSQYFGPYAHSYAITQTLDTLLKVYPIRTCAKGVFNRHAREGRPCLEYHIGRCSGPCAALVSEEEYGEEIANVMSFLRGNRDGVLNALETKMREAAKLQHFEAAANLRDQLAAVKVAIEKQHVASVTDASFDVCAWHVDDITMAVQVFFVRQGKVVGRNSTVMDRMDDSTPRELAARYLAKLYFEREGIMASTEIVGQTIFVPELPADHEVLAETISELRGAKVEIKVPQRGSKVNLIEMVATNAADTFMRYRLKRANDFTTRSIGLQEIQDALGLPTAPLRIECYDISTFHGTNTVASMVVMEDGLPKPSEYRRFEIKTVEGQDDFASMYEVITRRFTNWLAQKDLPLDAATKFAYTPQLVLIDGGKGQLGMARKALDDLGIYDIPLASLAKKQEEVFLPGQSESIMLPRGSQGLYMLIRIRDESHRFAITYHRSKRGKAMTHSLLDDIPGIGPAKQKSLMAHFQTIDDIKRATVEELCDVPGISEGLATIIRKHFRSAQR